MLNFKVKDYSAQAPAFLLDFEIELKITGYQKYRLALDEMYRKNNWLCVCL
ncbi:hypothetical protein MNBD_GAMMA16-643 [hydrothermal vent metagenome]|uniref:Uncharacterized protein n=1 Tax=hydrothermal vent metagenome TaxID=652676 RepID=A0A3B0ZI45_9ZZZZ